MNVEYTNYLPEWYQEETKLDLVLSNDIDSMVACALLKKIKGWNIKYFYDFDSAWASTKLKQDVLKGIHNEKCWVDVAIIEGKGFDNHVTRVSEYDAWNFEIINPNTIVSVTNEYYQEKYAGSTALLIWSLYDFPLPKTEEGKMLLLCIDSAYKGYYNDRFAEANEFFIDEMFGYTELMEVMQRHTEREFESLIRKYKLKELIYMDGGKLKTVMNLKKIGELLGIELEMPDDSFLVWKEFEVVTEELARWQKQTEDLGRNLFTLAFTYKNKARFSREKERSHERYNSIYSVAG